MRLGSARGASGADAVMVGRGAHAVPWFRGNWRGTQRKERQHGAKKRDAKKPKPEASRKKKQRKRTPLDTAPASQRLISTRTRHDRRALLRMLTHHVDISGASCSVKHLCWALDWSSGTVCRVANAEGRAGACADCGYPVARLRHLPCFSEFCSQSAPKRAVRSLSALGKGLGEGLTGGQALAPTSSLTPPSPKGEGAYRARLKKVVANADTGAPYPREACGMSLLEQKSTRKPARGDAVCRSSYLAIRMPCSTRCRIP